MSDRPQQRPLAPTPSQYQPQAGPATYTRAQKGKACLNCRRRKLKCDCAHPVCNQCLRFGREKDCEYSEKDQKSRSEILEGNIAVLQTRIRELESAASGSTAGPFSAVTQIPGWMELPDDMDFSDIVVSGHTTGKAGDLTFPVIAEPTYTESHNLIQTFLPYARDVGFFLNTSHFLDWSSRQIPGSSSILDPYSLFPYAPDEFDHLLSVVYLWGAVLGTDGSQKMNRGRYLERALQKILKTEQTNTTAGPDSHESRPDVVHLIQSHVLLANYFFHDGEFSAGRKHTADAVSLVVTYQLHKIRSPRPRDASKLHLVHAADAEMTLHPPADLLEEGERIHAFWQVYILDKTWATLLGCPSLLVDDGSPGTEIDTPWPLALEQYSQGILPPGYGASGQTIQTFISRPATADDSQLSPLALRAKAAALLYRATWFSSSCSADPAIRELHAANFELTSTLLDQFILTLPSLQTAQAQLPPDVLRHITVTHCLARMAVCQLNYAFSDNELKSAAMCMGACKAVIGAALAVPVASLSRTDPLLPVLMTMPAQIIAAELMNSAGLTNSAGSNLAAQKRPPVLYVSPSYLAAHIGEAAELLGRMNPDSKLTALQLEAIGAIRSSLIGSGVEFVGS